MMYRFLIILLIIVPGIDSSLKVSYLSYSGMPCSSHRSIMPINPSDFEFIGDMKMKYLEENTCESLLPISDGSCPRGQT